MKDLLGLFNDHVSVRKYIPGKKIPGDHIKKITAAGQRASSSYNLQLYSIISVEDPDLRNEMVTLCADQGFIRDASHFLVFCADMHKMEEACRLSGHSFFQKDYFESTLMSVIDTALAAENTAAAAESLGYGICFIGAVRYSADKIIKLLNLPEKVFPLFGLCIGFAEEKNPVKPRMSSGGVFYTDSYNADKAVEALTEYNELMLKSGIYSNREFPDSDCHRTGVSSLTGDYGWIEHSARRISTEKPEKVRPELKKQFEDSGFGFK